MSTRTNRLILANKKGNSNSSLVFKLSFTSDIKIFDRKNSIEISPLIGNSKCELIKLQRKSKKIFFLYRGNVYYANLKKILSDGL